jgi:release factor glutamine methyltransferase
MAETDNPASYPRQLSPERAERIRLWHDRSYQAAKADARTDQEFDYLGRTLVVPPDVMPITAMSHLLGEAVLAEVSDNDRVLDMGTGSGVNAVLAASRASHVLAVDINPHAIETARRNAELNGVADRIEVRHSDVFGAVDGAFDLIVFDPPFRWFAPRDQLEVATTDENYRAMTEFFRNAREHLTPTGRMLIFFGTSGDLDYLTRLAEEAGFAKEVVAHDSLERDGWTVDYFTFRMRMTSAHNQAGAAR